MHRRSKEEKRRIVEASFQPGITVVRVAQEYGVRPGQIFEWPRTYKDGGLTGDPDSPALLPVRLSGVASPPRLTPTTSLISIELPHARIEIHGATDPVTLGIVLECLGPMMTPGPSAHIWIAADHTDMRRGIHRLSALVQTSFSKSAYFGQLFYASTVTVGGGFATRWSAAHRCRCREKAWPVATISWKPGKT